MIIVFVTSLFIVKRWHTTLPADKCGNCKLIRQVGKAEFKICGKCKNILYCSKECQLTAWPNHKKVCKSILQSSNVTAKNVLSSLPTQNLFHACEVGLLSDIQRCISNWADVNMRHGIQLLTPLSIACERNHESCIKYLLQQHKTISSKILKL